MLFRGTGSLCIKCHFVHLEFGSYFHNHVIYRNTKLTTEELVKQMGKRSYWDEFYQQKARQESSFDWFFEYDLIRYDVDEIISSAVKKTPSRYLTVLDIGCGTSSFAHEIAGRHKSEINVWCVDFSQEALVSLKKTQDEHCHSETLSNVDYIVADGFNLPFPNAAFDIIFEKGTLDSLLKSNALKLKVDKYLTEMMRLLSKNGFYCQFSDEDPDLRLPLLEEAKQKLEMVLMERIKISFKQILPDSSMSYFVYYMSFEQHK
ncbi:citrate synthase-lysine N-methyltransferase CSKMT, mitochondrial-like isoform X2 [Apostichopus japonicus]|uniref:citrate synthase-lysine N-methyltransferase CSKMT, mitochondrial-like isoform X2 n=1 Tax=Stichopus japonicus TaxID=307972 RepID=UPI003AB3D87A